MYVDKQEDFEKFIDEVDKCATVAIDTEFLRDKTYWPKLCLLQMAIDSKYALIDPFVVDISSIKKILVNKSIVKVFHAPRQDIEILHHKVGVFPSPLFDTQTAAAFLGYGMQIGYGKLVNAELGVKLKKGDSFTDWSLRPLTKSQLNYAADDVTYLLKLYYKMSSELKSMHRLSWVDEDTRAKYLSKEMYEIKPGERYVHLRRLSNLYKKQIVIAKELCAWREKYAMCANLPRKWVLTDDQIVEICKQPSTSINALFRLRGLKQHLTTQQARDIVACVNKGLSYKKSQIPDINKLNKDAFCGMDFSDYDIDAIEEMCKALVELRASQNNIAPQVLCSGHDIRQIAHGVSDNLQSLSGWRKKLVGAELLDLINGKIYMSIKNGKIKIEKTKEE